MDFFDIRQIEIINVDHENSEPTREVNEYLEEGWVLLHIYTRDAEGSVPSQFPCFVVGYPRVLRRRKPKTESQDAVAGSTAS
jgi:hypothetical protein